MVTQGGQAHEVKETEEGLVVVIYDDDGRPLGACDGPDARGLCPWAGRHGGLPCNEAWLTAHGWTFRVAEDARFLCPLVVLGVVR
jgi:hypothetical protein